MPTRYTHDSSLALTHEDSENSLTGLEPYALSCHCRAVKSRELEVHLMISSRLCQAMAELRSLATGDEWSSVGLVNRSHGADQ